MAALCPGVHYGLSSQQNYGENRDLIFVKLTDSALRAIEEYLKNQNKFNNHRPTIKFLGNENGELSFPSMHHQTGQTSFNFSMSSTADMEGQGGSFECIKQVGSPRGPLEGLGSIPHKIRIHANDDVYEVTRNRMTEAEDKYKNKCTREIKPNQTDIGRKVKLKQFAGRAPLHPVHHRKEAMPSMRDSLLKQPNPTPYGKPQHLVHAPPAPAHHNGGPPNGAPSGAARAKVDVGKRPVVPEMNRRPVNNRKVPQPQQQQQQQPPPPPQTLTPPGGGSDGGSSGSGQSPNSMHAGSPPPPVTSSSKRPGFHEGPDGFAYKRQRIAHSTKPPPAEPPPPASVYHHHAAPPFEGDHGQRRPVTDSRDASNMNPRSRETYYSNGYLLPPPPLATGPPPVGGKRRPSSEDEEDRRPPVSLRPPPGRRQDAPSTTTPPPPFEVKAEPADGRREQSPPAEREGDGGGAAGRQANGRVRQLPVDREVERPAKYNKVSSSTDGRVARVSPDSQMDRMPVQEPDPMQYRGSDADYVEKENEFPDYRKQYVTIRDADQRRKYKVDFNADYAEYRDLHSIVERVSRKFALLEERLKQEDVNSPRYKDIKKQIVSEYQESKKDSEHMRAKRRFQYLHDKLSHIKKLVAEYDQDMVDCRY